MPIRKTSVVLKEQTLTAHFHLKEILSEGHFFLFRRKKGIQNRPYPGTKGREAEVDVLRLPNVLVH